MALITRCLLPAVAMLPEDPSVGQEVWQAIRLLPFYQRAELYTSHTVRHACFSLPQCLANTCYTCCPASQALGHPA